MRVIGLALTGLALLGLAGAAPAPGTVLAQLGPVTISATALVPGTGGTLTANVQVSTNGQLSDQLDAATAADDVPVAVYHRQVNVGELQVRKSASTTTWPCQAPRLVGLPASVVSGRSAIPAGTGRSTTVPR